jgi:NifU-like protein involved in Fe-S cluster formation
MSADPYSPLVRRLFAEPVHCGELDDAIVVDTDEHGVRLRLEARLDGRAIEAFRFRAQGCPHVIAAAESLCAGFEGRPFADLLEFRAGDLMERLSVPVEKTGRILVIEDAVRSLGQAIRDNSA